MATSIRDLVRREQALRMQAEAASRTKDDFLATLSHELRTPLNAILGWASILARTDQDRARVSHAVKVIERNARVQSQMIEELLDVSRIATGPRALERRRTCSSHRRSTPRSNRSGRRPKPRTSRFGKEIDPAARTTRADPRRLQQIIWNLLSNAVRFTPAGGHVEVTVRARRARLRRDRRGRYRMRHRSGISAARVRTFPSGRQQHDAHARRPRPRSGDRARSGRDARRHGARRERRRRPGHDVHRPAAGSRLSGNPTRSAPSRPEPAGATDRRERARRRRRSGRARSAAHDSRRRGRHGHDDARRPARPAKSSDAIDPDLLIADIGMPDEDGYSLILSIRNQENGTSRSAGDRADRAHAPRRRRARAGVGLPDAHGQADRFVAAGRFHRLARSAAILNTLEQASTQQRPRQCYHFAS